jgi:DNA-directed RNA polymerase subunit M/transcription elongation factor TFIIS
MRLSDLEIVRMYCPNCSRKLAGYKSRDEKTVRMECDKCGAAIVSKKKNAKTTNIQMTAPSGYAEYV